MTTVYVLLGCIDYSPSEVLITFTSKQTADEVLGELKAYLQKRPGWPGAMLTDEEKAQYCRDMMAWSDGFLLSKWNGYDNFKLEESILCEH